VEVALAEGEIDTALTHASQYKQVQKFIGLCGGRGVSLQAAGTSLLADPRCWLNGVRPGLALYEQALTVRARLVDVRESSGPAGYSGFVLPRFGLIFVGYSNGLRRGPCLINGRVQQVVEVGMQSSFVSVDPADKLGDQVSLLGDGLSPRVVAEAWRTSPQEVLYRLARGT
jgi:alanine racemase